MQIWGKHDSGSLPRIMSHQSNELAQPPNTLCAWPKTKIGKLLRRGNLCVAFVISWLCCLDVSCVKRCVSGSLKLNVANIQGNLIRELEFA